MVEFKTVKDACEVEWGWPSDRAPSKPTYFPLGRSKTVGRVRIDQPVTHRQIVDILLLLSQDKAERNNNNTHKSEASRHLLTQEEAADRLRCSVWTVKRLRLTGKLKYIPGRPNLIRVDDIDEFERSAARLNLRDEGLVAKPAPSPEEQACIDAAALARRTLLLKRLRGPVKRTPLTDEEKLRREAFREDQKRKRQRAALRRTSKAREKPKTP